MGAHRMSDRITSVSDILRAHYPHSAIARMLEVGAELPTVRCPPWWRVFARRLWIRDMNGRIAFAQMYGWRTNRGNARHHTNASKIP